MWSAVSTILEKAERGFYLWLLFLISGCVVEVASRFEGIPEHSYKSDLVFAGRVLLILGTAGILAAFAKAIPRLCSISATAISEWKKHRAERARLLDLIPHLEEGTRVFLFLVVCQNNRRVPFDSNLVPLNDLRRYGFIALEGDFMQRANETTTATLVPALVGAEDEIIGIVAPEALKAIGCQGRINHIQARAAFISLSEKAARNRRRPGRFDL